MFQKIAKHRANDASNDVHRPPLWSGGKEINDFATIIWRKGTYRKYKYSDYHWLILALRAFQCVTGPPSPGGQAFVMWLSRRGDNCPTVHLEKRPSGSWNVGLGGQVVDAWTIIQLEIEMEGGKDGVGKLVSATSSFGRGGLKGLEG